MRSSGPLGAHMAARPHLAPPLPPMHAAPAAPPPRRRKPESDHGARGTSQPALDQAHAGTAMPHIQSAATEHLGMVQS